MNGFPYPERTVCIPFKGMTSGNGKKCDLHHIQQGLTLTVSPVRLTQTGRQTSGDGKKKPQRLHVGA
jgi:hypothetical protein